MRADDGSLPNPHVVDMQLQQLDGDASETLDVFEFSFL